jgi:hypothetical protein
MRNIPFKYLLKMLLLLYSSGLFSQITKGNEYRPLSCSFQKTEEIIENEGTITNVLLVKNINGITREFYLELTLPTGWKSLNSSNKTYKLDPNDSMYIPVRIIPNKILMKGATKYNINVLVVGTDGRTHAICSFFAGKPKRTDWEISILPRSRIYFLNGQSQVPLSLYAANKGEEEQQLNISWSYLGRGLTLRSDSSSNKNFLDIKINSDKDTVLNFTADIAKTELNFNKIDIESYDPFADYEARKYRIYFKAIEPFYRQEKGIKNLTPFGFQEGKENKYRPASGGTSKTTQADIIKLNSSVDFIKLTNVTRINNEGSGLVPILWYSNLFNILGIQPMWGNNFITRFSIKKEVSIYGNLQHFFTYYSPSRQTYQNLQGFLYYTSPKLDIGIGQGAMINDPLASGIFNIGGSGRGISATYRPSRLFRFSSFYTQIPFFSINPSNNSLGFSAGYTAPSDRIQTTVAYSRTVNNSSSIIQTIGLGIRFQITNKQSFQGNINYLSFIDSISTPNQNNRQYVNWIARYNGLFFKDRLSQSMSATSNRMFLPNNGFTNIVLLTNNTNLRTSKYGIFMNNSYINFRNLINNISNNLIQIPSSLSFWVKNKIGLNTFPSIFHNYVSNISSRMHQVGMSISGNHSNFQKNIRVALNLRGAYSFYSDTLNYRPIFNANFFAMFGYRTFTANVGYNYGILGFQDINRVFTNSAPYPQYLFISLNKQYVFRKFKQFVFDFTSNYSWNNITYSHNLTLSPVIYFFSKKGWRFNATIFYNLFARNPELSRQFLTFQGTGIPLPEVEPGYQYSNNFNLQFGLRKEFGILLPKKWHKNFYSNPTFIAFLDFNGNRVKDKDEVVLENMVVQLNGHEAITDKEGKCQFLNVEQKRYFFNVIPLTDMDGWFSIRKDSVDITPSGVYHIPFTKGVKIEGTVLLDREKFTEDVIADLDLSKIRIFTTDTSGNTYSTLTDRKGNFSFYVPFGFYALSMDESIVSDRFLIAQNNIPVELEEGIESYYQAFFIIEKRRRVKKKKFNEKGELVYTEEVENNDGRPNKNKKAKDANDELGVFNETRKNGGVKKDSTELWRMNYEELDKRIQRLDSIINELKEKSVQGNTSNNNSQGFNQVVLMDALKKLKDEEERNTPYFIVQVASLPKGQTVPADILDRYNSGTLRILDDGANTVYYFGSKFTDVDKAVDAVGVAAKNKIGKPELKVQFKGKVMTLNDYKDANK